MVYRAQPYSLLSGYFQLKKKKKKAYNDTEMEDGETFSSESQGFLGLEELASGKVDPQKPLYGLTITKPVEGSGIFASQIIFHK